MFCTVIDRTYVLTLSIKEQEISLNVGYCHCGPFYSVTKKSHYWGNSVSAEVIMLRSSGERAGLWGLKLSCDVFEGELCLTPLDYMGLCPVNVQVWHRQESFLNGLFAVSSCVHLSVSLWLLWFAFSSDVVFS